MFFETIYRWFAAFFGGDMADYLSGYICPSEESEGGYLANNQFIAYGFIALAIALAVMLIYYYVINHPRFNKWWSWLLMLLLVGVSNFVIAIAMLWNEWYTVGTAECLIAGENGGIDGNTCIGFGIAHAIVSILFFIIFSIGFKWWSTNCKRSPF
ncbi:hypothetical protein AGMMS49525_05330 [Bacteroidia bacterium]|nr:hypothetical protein AGMMS49525_05330 [Bacteroidia bacterium]